MKLALPMLLLVLLSGCAASTPYYAASGSVDAMYDNKKIIAHHCRDMAKAKGYMGAEKADFVFHCTESLSETPVIVDSSPSVAYKFAQGLEAASAVGQGRTPLYIQEQQLGMTAYPPLYPYGMTQYSTIGQPDQFGPLGYRGPTWEQFNQRFTSPQR